ncbi:nuclear transport factor 2 family protein [Paracoccus sp. S1E-3]|uniref:nuclear transport factor 2 family protein n=1 Tax=Paracoccus sp. S1E-3 TaxID=2756130 RepID=UPI0015EF5D20|nr:nuclear transport factor 2 family protein [Paracoccus sp. S1E-3]MBA4491481.1 nuclear transport factor 2 family protein [Paracoccus sp. S1E-3]
MTTLELLDKFAAGWNAHDVDALLDCMTDDGVFYGSAGTGPDGATSRGKDELRKSYAALWATFPDAAWNDVTHFVSGDRAVTEWRFTGTKTDGSKVDVRGCDVFLIRDGKIAVKDTFRKQTL